MTTNEYKKLFIRPIKLFNSKRVFGVEVIESTLSDEVRGGVTYTYDSGKDYMVKQIRFGDAMLGKAANKNSKEVKEAVKKLKEQYPEAEVVKGLV